MKKSKTRMLQRSGNPASRMFAKTVIGVISLIICVICVLICKISVSQNVGINQPNPDSSALLDLTSTNMGLLIPRMNTTQRNAISSPAQSLMIYNTSDSCLQIYIATQWRSIFCYSCSGSPAIPGAITGTTPVCQSDNAVVYSVTNVGGVTYNWTYSGAGFTVATGQGTNSMTADFSGAATSGTLTVTPSNACGTGTAQALAITVNSAPAAPTAAAHTPSATQIIWNWNASAGAT